jgi:hypothetical protein
MSNATSQFDDFLLFESLSSFLLFVQRKASVREVQLMIDGSECDVRQRLFVELRRKITPYGWTGGSG